MRILLISGRRPYNFLNNFKNNFLPAGQSKNNLEDNLYIIAAAYPHKHSRICRSACSADAMSVLICVVERVPTGSPS